MGICDITPQGRVKSGYELRTMGGTRLEEFNDKRSTPHSDLSAYSYNVYVIV